MIFKFLSGTFWLCRKRLDKKAKVNFKIYDVTTSEKTIKIHRVPNISRSKGNQINKFGQLMEYIMLIFLSKNHTQDVAEKLDRHPVGIYLLKVNNRNTRRRYESELSISLDQQSEMLIKAQCTVQV